MLLLVAFIAFLLLSQSPPLLQDSRPTDSYLEPDAYKIYAVIVSNYQTWEKERPKVLVIREETTSFVDEVCADTHAKLPKEWKEAIKNYVRENKRPKLLRERFDFEVPYRLVSEKEIASIFTPRGKKWEEFYTRYPNSGGLIGLSQVGFDASKTKAVVYFEYGCGRTCGNGVHYFLDKKVGTWSLAGTPCATWMWWS